ncbi:Serine phosphatase RsbU, regulator of sigma subunit [Geosporobacter subterraneus DSM 17957]|uniref:Serine phosphatase RsbU, regulator of sigma subunit n=1 Tax=Geosporobacter subterraneus DSM 17957 TaxID=1121919 RepID=A0A1M6G7N4_9FIRM|nr:MASE3 domain-containing protein [Geosporobacter subterraneus]SHJ05953.1 Serine phosphatase RsbU, regulator of sigma subunit [Geosporobacter subterraneus DSM 17957]
MLSTKENKRKLDFNYIYLFLTTVGSLVVFKIAGLFDASIYRILGTNLYLSYHTLLEFASIVISFILFTITYYTYSKNHRIRLLVFVSVFFITGTIDFFHTMSYNGMPVFFTASSIPKATTFWMISRLILAFGLLISGCIPYNLKGNLPRKYFLMGSIVTAIGLFYIVTYQIDWFPPLFIAGQGLTPLKILLEYVVMFLFGITAVLYVRDYRRTHNRIFIIFASGLILGIFTEAAFTIYKSVYDTYNLLGHVYKILSSYLLFRAVFIYNLDTPYYELEKAREQIKLYAENLEKIVARRTAEIQKANEKMLEDLEYAKRIQQSLLPPKELNIYDVKFVSQYIPCEKLSGDFYHIHAIDEDNIGMFIADVAGHGISAAMMTLFADRVMKPSKIPARFLSNPSPNKMIKHMYMEFNKSDFPNEMHIVMFYAIYNRKTRVLAYCSGGMNSLPLLVRKNGELEILDKSMGFPICKFGDLFEPDFQKAEVKLDKGDRVLFYTDGLTEDYKDHVPVPLEHLEKILIENLHQPLISLNDVILDEIRENTKDIPNEDDITYFIMEV